MINLPFWKRKDYIENQISAAIVWLDIHADENPSETHSCSECRDVEEMLNDFKKDLEIANAVSNLETHLTNTSKHEEASCEMCQFHLAKIDRLSK